MAEKSSQQATGAQTEHNILLKESGGIGAPSWPRSVQSRGSDLASMAAARSPLPKALSRQHAAVPALESRVSG